MRNLSLEELEDKITDYSSDIKFSDKEHLTIKLNQFFTFLLEQPISKKALDRIEKDFVEISEGIDKVSKMPGSKRKFKETLLTRELQGAFAYFEIKNKFLINRRNSSHYTELAHKWYDAGGSYSNWQYYFNTYFFEPFIELTEWYLREAKIRTESDYFSKEEIEIYKSNYEDFKIKLQELQLAQEIIFNEIDETKNLISSLNKKNWLELIKGKFNDMILSKIISVENAERLIETITNEKIKLFF